MLNVEKDKVISLAYELRVDNSNGKVIESLDTNSPFTFLFGSGNLLLKFEDKIKGLKVGDKFDFDITSKDAYGEVNQNAIVDVPKQAFEINGEIDEKLLQVGNTIPMQDNSGNRLNGVVKTINGNTVKMDFNHPLAGNHLFFKGEILEIREPTAEELQHGHAHYPGSCEGCSDCGGEGGHC